MEYSIERVKLGDEATLAFIQTESWKAGFKDILNPDTLLRCTQVDKATTMYRRLLEQNIGNGYLLKVEGKPHCIAWWDATREKDMPGYADQIIMAAGTFVQGASIELSADGPLRPPYNVYLQGGLTFEHAVLGIMGAAQAIEDLQ